MRVNRSLTVAAPFAGVTARIAGVAARIAGVAVCIVATSMAQDTPLLRAVHQDDAKAVEQLVKAGTDVKAANRYGATPVSVACENGNAAMIELLL